MSFFVKLDYYFRKFPLLRFVLLVAFIALIIAASAFFSFKNKPVPVIESINPSVGVAGDVIQIYGKNFGSKRNMNYVEFSGSKLTSSCYVSWRDDCIKLVLPEDVRDGLVIVGVDGIRSKPAMFANAEGIPVPVVEDVNLKNPVISYFSTNEVNVGESVIIYGNNFGESRNQSKVYFAATYDSPDTTTVSNSSMIVVNEFEQEYEYWSNSEIHVRVPDGACSGGVVVEVGGQKSEPEEITVNKKIGDKKFLDRKIYLIKYTADIADVRVSGTDDAVITLRCPVPVTVAAQNSVEITDINPPPVLQNYQQNIIHQYRIGKDAPAKTVFAQTFVVSEYEINTNIKPEKVVVSKDKKWPAFLKSLTQPDSLIPSDNQEIIHLANSIVKKEQNPYKMAQLVYEYMLAQYEILNITRNDNANPLDLLQSKNGDAYDFSIVYTSLLRSLGIPCITNCGVLIGQNLKTKPHWWCEFYIKNFGWIPVDVALGSGLLYDDWNSIEKPSAYYFGNLDSHHILFSRGMNHIKSFSQDSKIVQRPKAFALQSFWEESSNGAIKYSSYWSDVVVDGVY